MATPDEDKELGEALFRARKRLGKSQAEVAREATISASALSRIESGVRVDLRISTARRLCKALGISLDRLAGVNADPKGLAKELRELKRLRDEIEVLRRKYGLAPPKPRGKRKKGR